MDHAMSVTAARKILEAPYTDSGIRSTPITKPVVQEYNVPANTLRMVFQSLASVGGPQYQRVLHDAGLMRFTDTLPPDTFEPLATGEELAGLYAAAYARLGEPLTRLFLRHYGRLLPDRLLNTEWGRQVVIQADQVPFERRLEWFLRELARITAQQRTRLIISEDEWAWYIALERCLICSGIRGVHAPICANGEVNYKGMAERVVGRRMRVIEVECVAMGGPRCKYAFLK
jgi:hypothetical protein